jgi:DNA-binding response OmpR family regulator
LAPLTYSDVEKLIFRYMEAYEAPFVPADMDFIYLWAGGHPAILEGVCAVLEEALEKSGSKPLDTQGHWQLHQHVARQLRAHENLQLECAKVWDGCTPEEQGELLAMTAADYEPDPQLLAALERRHIVFKVESKYQLFCRLMAEYVQRKSHEAIPASSSLWVDIESGQVLVQGVPVETLTNLEYRLILLLFNNAGKIVDKYQIVSNVWGESYIDEVDDTRIEKLISRVRQKIEPDPTSFRFLHTVRGRGYRLSLA